MNILSHFILNILVMLPFSLNPTELLVVGIAGVIIDIDHLFYFLFVEKKWHPKDMWSWYKKENAVHRPHFYMFHMVEFILIFMIVSFFINRYLFLVSIGFALHFLEDAIVYIIYHKNLEWIKSFSLFYYLK